MNWRSLLMCALAAALSLSTPTLAEPAAQQPDAEAITIPLDEIWAYQMPGTIKMDTSRHSPSGEYVSAEGPFVDAIRKALAKTPPAGSAAKPGFVVVGDKMEAIREAESVLVNGEPRVATVPANTEVWVVFFSYQFGPYVHIDAVERRGNVIAINYRFVEHFTDELSEHVALIPLGELSTGIYRVKVNRLPTQGMEGGGGMQIVNRGVERRIVSRGFVFNAE